MSTVLEELEQEQEHDDVTVAHLSDHPQKRIAFCGTPILGIIARAPYVRCVVCFDPWLLAKHRGQLWWNVNEKEER